MYLHIKGGGLVTLILLAECVRCYVILGASHLNHSGLRLSNIFQSLSPVAR